MWLPRANPCAANVWRIIIQFPTPVVEALDGPEIFHDLPEGWINFSVIRDVSPREGVPPCFLVLTGCMPAKESANEIFVMTASDELACRNAPKSWFSAERTN